MSCAALRVQIGLRLDILARETGIAIQPSAVAPSGQLPVVRWRQSRP
jgi:hypothetical protein